MHAWRSVLALVVATGCGASREPATAAPPPVAAPLSSTVAPRTADDVTASTQHERVVVETFDCFSTHEEKRTQSLRRWASGGPDGAAWNVEGAPLRCVLGLRVTCAGTAAVRVAGNERSLSERTVALAAGENLVDFELPAQAWEGALATAHLTSPGPYEVLLLSVSGFVACPAEVGVAHQPFADAFLAGFSGGE
jgi:hypothetical protein